MIEYECIGIFSATEAIETCMRLSSSTQTVIQQNSVSLKLHKQGQKSRISQFSSWANRYYWLGNPCLVYPKSNLDCVYLRINSIDEVGGEVEHHKIDPLCDHLVCKRSDLIWSQI